MLQLPSRAPRFTRAQIAEINRGAKVTVRVRVKRDPVIALVARADKLWVKYHQCAIDEAYARAKLPEADQEAAAVCIGDELLNVAWSNGYQFISIAHIDRQFDLAIKRQRQNLREYHEGVRRWRPGHGAVNSKLELEQRVASAQRKLHLLQRYRGPLKVTFRKEQHRVLKVQKAAGLVAARKVLWTNYQALKKVTAQIAESKPITAQGALVLAKYVGSRINQTKLFAYDGDMPGNFSMLMRSALGILSQAVEAQ